MIACCLFRAGVPLFPSWSACPLICLLLNFHLLLTAQAAPAPLRRNSEEQIRSLIDEKLRRTAVERKLDSKLLFTCRLDRGEAAAPGVPRWNPGTLEVRDGEVLVDLKSDVTPDVLREIRARGGRILNAFERHRAIRCWVPVRQIEGLATHPRVSRISPAAEATTHVGAVSSEGDITHATDLGRYRYAVSGQGVKVGVLSDSVNFLAESQAGGELPAVTVIPGQAGSGTGEGTAILELIHDLAPESGLYFATAFNGPASFAENIRALRAAGCQIIVDDVTYFNESPFQDGVIAQAVNEVSASGALYFSSAGNSGNKSDGTAAVWEGDFVDGGPAAYGRGGRLHDFGGSTFNTILPGSSTRRVDLFWSDPLGDSANDYDVYVLDASGNVVASSSNVQNGDDDPYESISNLGTGERVVIVLHSGVGRLLWLGTGRSALSISTPGTVRGHNASGADNAFSVAATWVRSPAVPFVGGGANPVERFSSGGPRRIIYNPDGTPITPGDVSSTGGRVLQKPDITAADGVRTSVPGFTTFFGTSAAAPHAAAIAALLWSYNPLLSPADVRHALQSTALDIEAPGVDSDSGHGIVMLPAAIEASAAPPPNLGAENPGITGGNGNQALDANECVQLNLTLRNRIGSSGLSATGVQAVLRSLTSEVATDPTPIPVPDIAPGESVTHSTPFLISTGPDFLCGSPALFELVLSSSNGGVQTQRLSLASSPLSQGPPVPFPAGGLPLPLPDLFTVESGLLVSGIALPLAEVSVSVHIQHSYLSDLTLDLIGPDGTVVNLSSRNGSSGQNYGVDCSSPTVFTDSATNRLAFGSAPFIGAFSPDQSLAAFNGKIGNQVNGTWRLRVTDVAEPDAGSLICWALNLTPAQCEQGTGPCFQPPLITSQPAPVFIQEGGTATFVASATGSPPLAYQWWLDETNIVENSTAPGLTLVNVSAVQAGAYSLRVTNLYGAVTSSPAMLNLITLPTIRSQPSNLLAVAGSDASLQAQAEGTPPLTYQWFRVSQGPVEGATHPVLQFHPVLEADSGDYQLVVLSPYGSTTSIVATVDAGRPPSLVSQPLGVTANQGQSVGFAVSAQGSEPLSFQWLLNENTPVPEGTSPTLNLVNVSAAQAGDYSVLISNRFGTTYSAQATLNVIVPNSLPSITLISPANNSVIQSTNLPLLLSAIAQDTDGSISAVDFLVDGLPIISLNRPPYDHEWVDPSPGLHTLQAVATDNLGGRATSSVASVIINLPQDNLATLIRVGSIWRYLDDGSDQGSAWSQPGFDDSLWLSGAAELGYGDEPQRPEATVIGFGEDPSNKHITAYFRRQFHITDAASYTNLVMRILRDDGAVVYLNGTEVHRSNLPSGPVGHRTLALQAIGGNNETLFVSTNVAANLLLTGWNTVAAEVHQSATNSSDLGFDFELSGLREMAPRITSAPESVTAFVGESTEFRVSAQGPSPLHYQWFFNSTQSVQQAASDTLALGSLTLAASGAYQVVVSNAFGSVTSPPALLTVLPLFTNRPPTIDLVAPTDGSVIGDGQLPVLLQADVTDADEDPLSVSFIIDGVEVATLNQPPYQLPWLDPTPGPHRIEAIVTDDDCLSTTSAVVHVTVQTSSTGVYPLIGWGALWAYDDRGIDLGNDWIAPDFSEEGWKQGAAELGYGDASEGRPEATLIGFGPSANNRFPTAYFRRSFLMTDPAEFSALRFRLLRDDGVVVHLNGAQVFSDNMPQGAIGYTNLAIAAISGAAETNLLIRGVTNQVLVSGWNVLAVEVHQSSRTSSDLSFDLALEGFRAPRPVITGQPESLTVSNGLDATFTVVAQGTPPLRYRWWFNATNTAPGWTNATLVLQAVASTRAGEYACEVLNDFGSALSEPALLTVLGPVENRPPVISLTSPSPGATVSFGLPMLIKADAFDADGTVARVDFLIDGQRVGSSFAPPYGLDWVEGVPGEHDLVARATDNQGLSTTTPAVRFVTGTPPRPAITLISTGAVWKYLDTGVDQRTAWRAAGFNDGNWPQGPALLGYGNASKGRPEATLLDFGSNPNQRIATYYFRHYFVITNPGQITRLIFRTLRDDGVRVFVNGVNAFRDNLPSGTVGFTTLATTAVTGVDETTYFTNTITPSGSLLSGLEVGTNVIAAEVHQASRSSDDLAFDLELQAEVNVPPILVLQPQSQTVTNGGTVDFRVVAYGPGTLSYQWQLNGTNIPGTRSAPSLTLAGVQAEQAGLYTVLVRNSFGTNSSVPALLTVLSPPPNQPPVASLISPANNSVFRQGEVISLQAQASDADGIVIRVDLYDGTNRLARLTNAPYLFDWAGAVAGEHLIGAVAMDDRGATNVAEPVILQVVSLPPPPGSTLTLVSTGAVWRYLDTGVDQGEAWRQDGFDDAGWSNGVAQLGYGDGDEATLLDFGASTNKHPTYYFRHSWEIEAGVTFDEASLALMRDDGAVVHLNGVEVFRSNMPTGAIAFATRALSVVDKEQEGRFFDTNIPPALLRAGINVLAVEIHQVNAGSSDVSFDLRLLGKPITLPQILQQPVSLSVSRGSPADFEILATGAQPLSYQWFLNGLIPIPDATNANLSLAAVQSSDEGSYSVVVANSFGETRSDAAILAVILPPAIDRHPDAVTVSVGEAAIFQVEAQGTAPLSYQWFYNEISPINGAIHPVLQLANVQVSDAGGYTVQITNLAGSVTSVVAQLSVGSGPQPVVIQTQPQDLTLPTPGPATFRVDATGTPPLTYQWYLNTDTIIPGATTDTLTLADAQASEMGTYSVRIANNVNQVESRAAELRVLIKPRITSVVTLSNSLDVTFTSLSRLRYTVQSSPSVSQPAWVSVAGAVQIKGTGNAVTIPDPAALGGRRFYRVLVE